MKPPSKQTLAKYGLSELEWLAILDGQGGVCPICGLVPKTGRWVTDHEHCRGYKKMTPEERASRVRGICCWWCNKTFLGRGISVERARAVVNYLLRYETEKLLRCQDESYPPGATG